MIAGREFTALLHFVQTCYACSGLLGYSLDLGPGAGIEWILGQLFLDRSEQEGLLFVAGFRGCLMSCSALLPSITRPVASPPSSRIMFGEPAVIPLEDAVGVVPVLFQSLAFDSKHGDALGGDCCRGVVCVEKMLQEAQRTSAPSSTSVSIRTAVELSYAMSQRCGRLERLLASILLAQRHQTGHLGLGDVELFPTEIGLIDIGDDAIDVRA